MSDPRQQGLEDLVNYCAAGLVALMIRQEPIAEPTIRAALAAIAAGLQDGTLGLSALDDSERATYATAVGEAAARINAALDQLLALFPAPEAAAPLPSEMP